MASKREQEIAARKAADPLAQALGRDDIDYASDELPTAPRAIVVEPKKIPTAKHCPTCTCGE